MPLPCSRALAVPAIVPNHRQRVRVPSHLSARSQEQTSFECHICIVCRETETSGQRCYRFLISVAQPSIPSPLVPTAISSFTASMPGVSFINSWLLMPPAFALPSGGKSSMGVKNRLILLASSTEKWYFSRKTSGRAQCRSRWMFRSSPFRLKISCDHLPDRHNDFGNGPRSSMI